MTSSWFFHILQIHELSECDQSSAMSKSVAPWVAQHTTCIFKVTEHSVMKTHMNNTAYGLFRFQNKVVFLAYALKVVQVTAGCMINEWQDVS